MRVFKTICACFLSFFLNSCYSSYSTPVTFDEPKRLLLLDGEDGTVACRIYGHLTSGTLPRFSDNWTIESATRSLLRMQNLTAVRGLLGAGMAGPLDYFGNLEEPHKYLYTIKNQFPPVFFRELIAEAPTQSPLLQELDSQFFTVVKAHWVSGKEGSEIREKSREYNTDKQLQYSLFVDPGLLEVDTNPMELLFFDPRGVDLTPFKARLVNNEVPFRITEKELPSKDDYRLVTYLYEPLYADWQVEHGSGLFLEKHKFSQTITPLHPEAKGYVVLARTNENPDELEMIGVQIPYGYTLVIEEDCIHGDTTLSGFFMMGMTSDHTTMRTADTVFLKCRKTKKNAGMILRGEQTLSSSDHAVTVPPPYVIYQSSPEQERMRFWQLTYGQSFIFNPFSREYWQF